MGRGRQRGNPRPPDEIAQAILDAGPGAYLLTGENGLDKEEVADIVIERAVPEGMRAFNVDRLYADDSELTADSLVSAVTSWPTMAEVRVVAVRGAEGAREEIGTALARLAAAEGMQTILLVDAVKLDARRKWSKELTRAAKAYDFPPPKGRSFIPWAQRLASRHGAELDPQAAGLLEQFIGDDAFRAGSEIEKLATYVLPGKRIGVGEVEAVVGITREDTVYELTDRIAERNVNAALRIAHRLVASDQHPAYLAGVIVRHWNSLRVAADLLRTRRERELGDVLGERRPFLLDKYLSQAKRLRTERIRVGFRLAVGAESAIKAGWSPPEAVLDALICQLTGAA